MYRYFIKLSYNGTRFCGWQKQPNGMSVQQVMEDVLSRLLQSQVDVVGAGRTDAGVHADMMMAHFDTSTLMDGNSMKQLEYKMNMMLPQDVAIRSVFRVVETAHARFSAIGRTYTYFISEVKDPFQYERILRMPLRNMDFDAMNRAAAVLSEYTDFTSFSKLHTDVKTNICHIRQAHWQQDGDCWFFTITADRFLRNMVRSIVGTLFEIGRHKIDLDAFRKVIEAKDRGRAGMSVPARGLSLIDVQYPSNIFIE